MRRYLKTTATRPSNEKTISQNGSKINGKNETSDESIPWPEKLSILRSLYPDLDECTLSDLLEGHGGSVQRVTDNIGFAEDVISPRKRRFLNTGTGCQSSLLTFGRSSSGNNAKGADQAARQTLTRKGQTLHLYSPEDIEKHTPCSLIHNFLPRDEAEALLRELLDEAPSFKPSSFKLFDNVVTSPHSACFYVDGVDNQTKQQTEYLYNGSYLTDVRQITPHMRAVSDKVERTVNLEIERRIKSVYPNGRKLRFQSPQHWVPNAAFVNCYKGGGESVGYHSDQLTYLGPRATIGSISLGVAREFRVRRIVPREEKESKIPEHASSPLADARANAEGQIAIHLPHNSLLVMHAEMQEEWKHSIHPAAVIDPHDIAGNKRINITYRYYRDSFHPKHTPRCNCNVPTVLRCVQKRKETHGRYMWTCHAGNAPGKVGCTYFKWAEFDDDGEPPWAQRRTDISSS